MTPDRQTDSKSVRENSFGQRLAKLRVSAHLSQSGLAKRVGVSQSAISQMESGERHPTLIMLRNLAYGVRVPLGLLLDDYKGITEPERTLLQSFRGLSPTKRTDAQRYLAYLVSQEAK